MPGPEGDGTWRRRLGLAAGGVAFLLVALIPSGLHDVGEYGARPAFAAATAALMAVWWFTEALPIHWTAAMPLLLYPLLGVFGAWLRPGGVDGTALLHNAVRSVAPYADAYVFLFLGGMMIGAASERSNLHRRVALHIMRATGTGPRGLLLGVLAAAAFLSMWISNTATAVMMMPIGMALLAQLEAANGGRRLRHFGTAVMLGIAYGCNVGGIGSKIGTPPNSVFCGWVQKQMGIEISFPFFMLLGMPFVILFLPMVWAVLWRLGRRDGLDAVAGGRETLDRELAAMGPVAASEKKVLAVFLGAAVLWMSGGPLARLLAPHVPAFWGGFAFREKHFEAWVAMAAGLLLLALRVLPPSGLRKIPWGTLVLLGGGFAMAAGISGSGLNEWLFARLGAMAKLPLFWQIGLASLVSVALSAVASNTATSTVMMGVLPRSVPVLAGAAFAASCDFMLPAGTPPNAIVFGSGYVRLPVMIRTGFLLDLMGAAFVAVYAFLYIRPFFS